jgi:DNA-binding transcriptional MocR family regulator
MEFDYVWVIEDLVFHELEYEQENRQERHWFAPLHSLKLETWKVFSGAIHSLSAAPSTSKAMAQLRLSKITISKEFEEHSNNRYYKLYTKVGCNTTA